LAKRQKTERVRFRRAVQLFFAAATNSYVTGFAAGRIYQGKLKQLCHPGLNCYSCPGALLSCPIGALQAVIGSRGFSLSLYVFGFLLFVGALLGRMVCGFLCPFGLIQELVHKIPFPKKIREFKLDKPLRYVKYAVLLVMIPGAPGVRALMYFNSGGLMEALGNGIVVVLQAIAMVAGLAAAMMLTDPEWAFTRPDPPNLLSVGERIVRSARLPWRR